MSNRFTHLNPIKYTPVQEPLELLKYVIDAKRKQIDNVDDGLAALGELRVNGYRNTGYEVAANKVNKGIQERIDNVYNYIKANPHDYQGAERMVKKATQETKRDFIVGEAGAITSATKEIENSVAEGMKNIGKEGGYSATKFNTARQNFIDDNQDIGYYDPALNRFTKGTSFVAPPKDPDYFKMLNEVVKATPELKNVSVQAGRNAGDPYHFVDITTGYEVKLPETLKANLLAQLRNSPEVNEDIDFNVRNQMRALGANDYNTYKLLKEASLQEKANAIGGYGYTNIERKLDYRENFGAREALKHLYKTKEDEALMQGIAQAGQVVTQDAGLLDVPVTNQQKGIVDIPVKGTHLSDAASRGAGISANPLFGNVYTQMYGNQEMTGLNAKVIFNDPATISKLETLFTSQGVEPNRKNLNAAIEEGVKKGWSYNKVLEVYNKKQDDIYQGLVNTPYRGKSMPFASYDKAKSVTDLIMINEHYPVDVYEDGKLIYSRKDTNLGKIKEEDKLSGKNSDFAFSAIGYPGYGKDQYSYTGYKNGRTYHVYPTLDSNDPNNNDALRLHKFTLQARTDGQTEPFQIPLGSALREQIIRGLHLGPSSSDELANSGSVYLQAVDVDHSKGTLVPKYKVYKTLPNGKPDLRNELGTTYLTEDANEVFEMSRQDIINMGGSNEFSYDKKTNTVNQFQTIRSNKRP